MVRKLLFVIVLMFLVFPGWAYAQDSTSASRPVEYDLPYPGLLPDHPLYFLRAIRDTFQNLLVSKPLEKAEYYLLQADKGVSASSMLTQKHETHKLAGAVAVESQLYVVKAIDAVNEAQKQGMEAHDIARRLVIANKKHQEILSGLVRAAAEEEKETFEKALQESVQLEKKAKALLPKK